MGPGRVIEAHCEIRRHAGPAQMTVPSGGTGTLQFTRMSTEHVDPDQSADKRPADNTSRCCWAKVAWLQRLQKSRLLDDPMRNA